MSREFRLLQVDHKAGDESRLTVGRLGGRTAVDADGGHECGGGFLYSLVGRESGGTNGGEEVLHGAVAGRIGLHEFGREGVGLSLAVELGLFGDAAVIVGHDLGRDAGLGLVGRFQDAVHLGVIGHVHRVVELLLPDGLNL
ncbi:hypothetical protein T230_11975 [Tannerella sp. oral taxon BU063 isolate Cell 1/3]|uniref:Uncharacterized protein n=1 Tax=Tannerella sp. oral taxon BU063 isolate Cell 1/3 TaxID=1411022 RepID=W2CJ30_9BACT|nr:hypothetical protein T230_11975 [Tannerella sp. oral taxon BU063 isolate Cell 1/3]